MPKSESDHEESKSESEEDEQKAHKRTSKKAVKEDQTTPVKKITDAKTAKSNDKTPKKSSSKKAAIDNTKQSASKKQKTAKESQNSKGKVANKKQTEKFPKALANDQGWVFLIAVDIICILNLMPPIAFKIYFLNLSSILLELTLEKLTSKFNTVMFVQVTGNLLILHD